MIEFIRGNLISKAPSHAIIECNGVGFLLAISLTTFDRLPQCGAEAKLFAHLSHREDAMELFGFATENERSIFRKLVAVSGVGPKTALAALSGISPADFALAVESGDIKLLSKIPRIGKKTAERIIIELRGKLELAAEVSSLGALGKNTTDSAIEAISALESLGFDRSVAAKAVAAIVAKTPDACAEDIIRKTLAG